MGFGDLPRAAPRWVIHRMLELPSVRDQRRQDALTDLFTAPYLAETCTRELNRGDRFNRPVSLLLLDLDGLRELNAMHGQQASDAVLRGTARSIKRATREYDLPARLDGGLFGVLLPETDLAAAQNVAERIRRSTADRRHEVPNSIEQARLTVSIGGAVHISGTATTTELFGAAQAALARAKAEGGNRTNLALFDAAPTAQPGEPAANSHARTQTGASDSYAPALHAPALQSPYVTWPRGALLVALAGVVLGYGVVQSQPSPDWPLLVALTTLAALAGLVFYFKPLSMAVALTDELHRSPARLWAARYWRLWPQCLAVLATVLLVSYAFTCFGLAGAAIMAATALLFRRLADQYVDRTLDSVRLLRSAKEQLEHRAFHDPLTSLANRALFAERLQHAMLRATKGTVAVLFLDLDNFKTVNDSYGHAAGDALLIGVTRRLLQCVRRQDTVARLGGDEFTVLLEDMLDPSDAARMAERIAAAMLTPFEVAGQPISVSLSIGIALDADRSHLPEDLIREADMAMYRAKAHGKARYEIFDTGMGLLAIERLELEAELRHAAELDQLLLQYQPVVSLATGQADAVEAVLCWQHPRHGLLRAGAFLPMANETDTMVALGNWVLRRACADAVTWQRRRPGTVVQVNLAQPELEQTTLAESVAAILLETGLAPACLRLEIPESSVVQDGQTTAAALDELNALGVRLALDDVGGGVSSLNWMSRVRVDVLKTSGTMIDSPQLIRATVALADALGMSVTAQAVVRSDQAAALAVLGCRHAQGPLYGEPMEAAAVVDVLSSFEPRLVAA